MTIFDHLFFSGLDVVSTNPQIQSWETNIQTGSWASFDLEAGATGSLTLIAELNDRYDAGTLLPNETWIVSSDQLINT
ncbi:MAG: hypothetical protein GXP45_03595 [bacterium]|nr:hypothetical protein [bacterium]